MVISIIKSEKLLLVEILAVLLELIKLKVLVGLEQLLLNLRPIPAAHLL